MFCATSAYHLNYMYVDAQMACLTLLYDISTLLYDISMRESSVYC